MQFIKTDELIGLKTSFKTMSYKQYIYSLLYLLLNDLATNYLVQCLGYYLDKNIFVIIGNILVLATCW